MSSTYDQIANIIAETCDIPRDTIKPESHAIDDLGIDSLDFLDIAAQRVGDRLGDNRIDGPYFVLRDFGMRHSCHSILNPPSTLKTCPVT